MNSLKDFGLSEKTKCPLCASPITVGAPPATPYLYNVEYDREILPMREILECSSCALRFSHPMPDLASLDNFYQEIYRAPGRPHHLTGNPKVGARHLAYLSFMSLFVDLQKARQILEIGAGWGEMGQLLTAVNRNLRLETAEPDTNVHKQLEKAGYSVLLEGEQQNREYDLVISTHSLEHFSSIDAFFDLAKSLRRGGYFFVEVPNCSLESGWTERPYDSPHLLFFDADTLASTFEQNGFKAVLIREAGVLASADRMLSRAWKDQFQQWTPSKRSVMPGGKKIRALAHKVLPERLANVLRAAISVEGTSGPLRAARELTHTVENGSVIRGIFQKI